MIFLRFLGALSCGWWIDIIADTPARQRASAPYEMSMSDQTDLLHKTAAKLGIGGYRRHVLLCTGPNCCTPEEGLAAWEVLKQQVSDRGLGVGENACYRTKVGCLRICCHGPTLVVYPEGTWY